MDTPDGAPGRSPDRGRPGRSESPVVEAYRSRLVEAGRLESPAGAHVLHLAQLLAAGPHTASGAAALSRELRAAMDEALKGAPVKADGLDELAARRDQKANGAG